MDQTNQTDQPADLAEKSGRYKTLLKDALLSANIVPEASSHLLIVAKDYLLMAESYYTDGVHFLKSDDPVNALVAFSYGHAFIDAGVRLGVLSLR